MEQQKLSSLALDRVPAMKDGRWYQQLTEVKLEGRYALLLVLLSTGKSVPGTLQHLLSNNMSGIV